MYNLYLWPKVVIGALNEWKSSQLGKSDIVLLIQYLKHNLNACIDRPLWKPDHFYSKISHLILYWKDWSIKSIKMWWNGLWTVYYNIFLISYKFVPKTHIPWTWITSKNDHFYSKITHLTVNWKNRRIQRWL